MTGKRAFGSWFWFKIWDKLSWKNMSKDERSGRFFRDGYVVLSGIISLILYYFCFVSGTDHMIVPALLFTIYLFPIATTVVLYGFGGSMVSFALLFIGALIMEPSNVYLIFFHLIALYCVWSLRRNGRCATVRSTLICSLIIGGILFCVYYSVFVMVGRASFISLDLPSLLFHLVSVLPQCIIICFFLYVYRKKFSFRWKTRLGVMEKEIDFRKEFKELRKQKKSPGIGEKVFMLLLVEAIILGFAAAGFANSLVPAFTGSEEPNGQIEFDSTDDGSDEAVTNGDNKNSPPDNINNFMGNMGFDETYAVAQINAQRERFKYNEKGVAFDLKLIMMLLCAIHPIVFLSNFIAQLIFAQPIEQMTRAMKDFTDDPESRKKAGHELGELGISTGDEIEELYSVLYETVGELNSYIDRIKEEQKLQEDLRVAKAASEAKSNFLSNVSHEIRTPINAVLGLDEMILRESREKSIKKYAVDIKNSGKTLLALINDLLDFSKIEAGKMEILPVEYELSSVINDLINMVRTKAQDKGLELKIDVAQDIPHVLYGDEIRVKQCILNILNNAVKYTQKGSVTMMLQSRWVSDGEIALKVNVIDTGIGIKEEDLSKLYSPFERIEESRNRTIEGTGLGMSIVKQLLDMMGSSLHVKSVYGEGSDFSFEVVQKVINPEPIGDFNLTYEKSLESMSEYAVSFVAPDARILVVDDTPMNLTVIRGLLKETLINVDTAQSGFQCLEMVSKERYDMIFMDQRMPEMDGTETLLKMKELSHGENKSIGAPVICLTANVVSGAREGFIRAGFTDYLSKPIDASKLEQMLETYLPKEKVLSPESNEGKKAISAAGAFENTGMDPKEAGGSEETAVDNISAFETFMRNAEGLDFEAGLRNCMKEEILKEAVHDFYVGLKENPDSIENYWKNGDIRNYTIKVHALKSSSRLIGAAELSEKAAFLEKCGDENDTEKIDELTPSLLALYRGYEDILKPLYETDEGALNEKPRIDDKTLSEGYFALKESVTAFDFDTADEIIKMLSEYSFEGAEKERFKRVCDLVTSLDRDAILEVL